MSEVDPVSPWRTVRLAVVEESERDSCFTVGLSEDEDGMARSLVFQCCSREPDGQDIRLGLDTYCTITECAAVHYGGVDEVTLNGHALRLVFGATASAELGLDGESAAFDLDLDIPSSQLVTLADGFRRVFGYGNPEQRPRVLEFGVTH
jgi:immunity protein 10 of polymorphic toxin system